MPINLEEQQTAGKNLITYQRISVKGKVTLEIKMKYAGEEKDVFQKSFKGTHFCCYPGFSLISQAKYCVEHVVRLQYIECVSSYIPLVESSSVLHINKVSPCLFV